MGGDNILISIIWNLKNYMEKIKQYKYIILIAVIILGFIFYWFQIRPTQIVKNCTKETNNLFSNPQFRESDYKLCLRLHGLEK